MKCDIHTAKVNILEDLAAPNHNINMPEFKEKLCTCLSYQGHAWIIYRHMIEQGQK